MSLCISPSAFAWGELGHRLVAGYGTQLADPAALANCHVSAAQIVDHTNDPDKIWRQQRFKHRNEAQMHFFHVDRQPPDWRSRSEPKDPRQGRLTYRIVDWMKEAKELRKSQNWDELAQHLYGLSHYVGDLTQPLHNFHDYDGEEAGLPDIHAQFETKMMNRFEDEARAGVQSRLAREKIPVLWQKVDFRQLIFDISTQSSAKAPLLLRAAKPAFVLPRLSARSRKRRKSANALTPRFEKKALWEYTGGIAMDQLATGARLWAYTLNAVCR